VCLIKFPFLQLFVQVWFSLGEMGTDNDKMATLMYLLGADNAKTSCLHEMDTIVVSKVL
jgi:hypothetical protein